MKITRPKLRLSLAVTIISGIALAGIIFTEDLRALTEEKDKARRHEMKNGEKRKPKEVFDPRNCSVTNGNWVFAGSDHKLLYTDETCPYIDSQMMCRKNGRPDSDYLHWLWKPDNCTLPPFDPLDVLERLRGKRLMFVGDSLQQEQWISFVCLVQSAIPNEAMKSMNRGLQLSVFSANEYNATIEFYWAPFLVKSNTDKDIIYDTHKRIIHVDSISEHGRHWIGVDILIFDTYVWWMSGHRLKSVWGSFPNGDEGYEELDAWVAYRIGLKTWANWVDSYVNPNETRVFFTTMSPTHIRSEDWHHDGNIRCYNETQPVRQKGYWGTGSDHGIMEVLASVVQRMTVPVTFLNVTQMSEHRIDGHVTVYTEFAGKKLTDEQKADPEQYADCIHWCLPGVPDAWNQLFYAYL